MEACRARVGARVGRLQYTTGHGNGIDRDSRNLSSIAVRVSPLLDSCCPATSQQALRYREMDAGRVLPLNGICQSCPVPAESDRWGHYPIQVRETSLTSLKARLPFATPSVVDAFGVSRIHSNRAGTASPWQRSSGRESGESTDACGGLVELGPHVSILEALAAHAELVQLELHQFARN